MEELWIEVTDLEPTEDLRAQRYRDAIAARARNDRDREARATVAKPPAPVNFGPSVVDPDGRVVSAA